MTPLRCGCDMSEMQSNFMLILLSSEMDLNVSFDTEKTHQKWFRMFSRWLPNRI